ncbi:MAG: TraB/GumN family protein [Candidatus Diapherotrites archaeon]|uniref:TraB/GumN family protein n=1 Tax=Candidatus Iainarchaeum sp. TaxID=3101447 RepID=A0A938YS41_9ARCH|nr:TraB/GumN family protein [Candidatus Diapherotrites archaeon]
MFVEKVKAPGKEIVLVGTAHVSRESVELVKKTVESEKPDVIGIELDMARLQQLKSGKKWQETDLGQIIREGKTYLFLINILLANLQRQIGDDLGVKPGSEMLQAVEIAEEKKIPIILLDRDVKITLKRALDKTGVREKLKLGYSILSGFFGWGEKLDDLTIESLKEKDTLNALMQKLGEEMPSVKSVLVDERDIFIANAILKSPGKKIVAVVGAGHLEGIKRFLDKRRDVRELMLVEKRKSRLRYLKFLVPALFIAIIGYGFYSKGIDVALNIFIIWFLVNGILSALGAAIARAHPLSILAAFIAAPFTSLHPAFAAGWFAGLVELKMRSPKVKDFEELPALNGLRQFTRNRVSRILIVTAFANIGSTIGTIIALPYIATLLA